MPGGAASCCRVTHTDRPRWVCSHSPLRSKEHCSTTALTWVCTLSTTQAHSWVIFINLSENCTPFSTPSLQKHSLGEAASVMLHSNSVPSWCLQHAQGRQECPRPGDPVCACQPPWTSQSLTKDVPRPSGDRGSETQACISQYKHRTFCLLHPYSEANPAHTWRHRITALLLSLFVFFLLPLYLMTEKTAFYGRQSPHFEYLYRPHRYYTFRLKYSILILPKDI